ncbi:hypothetical protein CHS0354_031812 [Potamilus streckersoni]|uniref:Uncharacterized protein n=1 Tax=Potamilus streckersoni TaxID=2493646 RepID=A0AAE0RXX1_9BIVA|nr:hypothetical protein CHS0354_031812 [Potamilus streckersoni]
MHDRVRRLKRSKEGSCKTSTTCEQCSMSMRERHELEEDWKEENGLTSFVPAMTIGSAFDSSSHGPTPPLPPPPTKKISHTVYADERTDSDYKGCPQTLLPPHSKTLPNVYGKRCPKYVDNEYDVMKDVEPLHHTLDYHLDQTNRLCQLGLTDARCKQPSWWDQQTDDYRHYSLGKITDVQSLTREENTNDNSILVINEILENAEAIQVSHETTLSENLFQELVSTKENDTIQKHFNPILDGDNASYIDMTAAQTLSDEEENVQMKITLKRSAAVEICRKARLRGISCTSEVMYRRVIDTPTKFSVDYVEADEDYAHINTCYPVYIEITD